MQALLHSISALHAVAVTVGTIRAANKVRLRSCALEPQLPSLAYIKTAKTGGSTFGGVLRRIGFAHGLAHVRDSGSWLRRPRARNESMRSLWANHGSREEMEPLITKHMPMPLYLSSVRCPMERCMAAYYHFRVGRHGANASDPVSKLRYVRNCDEDKQMKTMQRYGGQTPVEVLDSYDLVMVTGFFEQSLLALRQLLISRGMNVSMNELLYVRAKESGMPATDARDDFVMPTHPPFSEEPEEVKAALQAKFANSKDAKLHSLAQMKLMKLTWTLRDTQILKARLLAVRRHCYALRGSDCFWNDNGCAQSCINKLVGSRGWL